MQTGLIAAALVVLLFISESSVLRTDGIQPVSSSCQLLLSRYQQLLCLDLFPRCFLPAKTARSKAAAAA